MKTYYKNILRCWQILKPFHKWFYVSLVAIFLVEVSGIYMTYVTSKILTALTTNQIETAIIFAGLYLVTNYINSFFDFLESKIAFEKLDQNVFQYIKIISFKRILTLNLSQQIEDHSLVKKQNLDDGETGIKKVIDILINDLTPIIFMIIISLSLLFFYSITIGTISLISLIILLIWSYKFAGYFKPFVEENRKIWVENSKMMNEAYQHINLIKEFSQEDYFSKKLFSSRRKNVDYHIFTWMKNIRNWLKRTIFTRTTETISIIFAIVLFSTGKIELGLVYLIFSLNTRVYNQIGNITRNLRDIPIEMVKIEKYLNIIDKKPDFNENGIKKFEVGDIVFENLSFKYPKGEHNVLNNFNLTIQKGQKVALIGHSGNGKTTLSRLLMRAYNYDNGSIKIGNHELKSLDAGELRHKIGYVSQHIDLFDDTVRENILFGVREKDLKNAENKIEEIAKLSRITEFYHRLGEKKLDQYVGEKGVKLSGGERQRIGIARAIIKNPEILIFDEATASLDAENERYIKEAIDEVSKNKTTIIIAHRLSTIINCDVIHIIDKGQVIASGTHRELLEKSEFYNTLINSQEIEK